MRALHVLIAFLILFVSAESLSARAGGGGAEASSESTTSSSVSSEPRERSEKDVPATEGEGLFLLYVFGGIAAFFLIVALIVKIKNRKK